MKTPSNITAKRLNFNRGLALAALLVGCMAALEWRQAVREIRARDATVEIQHTMICDLDRQADIVWDTAWEQSQIMRDAGITGVVLPAPPQTPYECQKNVLKRREQRYHST